MFVKRYEWNNEKNKLLEKTRGVSFEMVVDVLKSNKVLDVIEHPNKQRYPNQKIYLVNIKNYIYLAPFVEDSSKVFLKTIIPSRKMTKKYLKTKEDPNENR